MAMFDRKSSNKTCLDDTEPLTVSIENAQTVSSHTEYIIRVYRGPNPEQYWIICKRYNDFVALHSVIQGSGINITLPPKKIIGNMNRAFIAQRQLELQNYINLILQNPILASNLAVKKFLDPQSYANSLQELALQQVSMALRSEVNYELIKPLPDLGLRLRKHHFLVKSNLATKSEFLLQWVEFGPDRYLEDKEIQNVLTSLVNLDHPNIEKIEFSYCSDRGCFTVRKFHENGTLRDLIHGAKPKWPVLKKYGNIKHSRPLSLCDISSYGRQILETLIFLNEKGLSYGHLHLGNILIEGNNIKLLDIENTILGLSSFYRPYIVQHKRINTLECVDVYLFGHALFEMAFGYPLNDSVCDNLPPTCPPLLGVLLESILSTESCKTGLPSIQELLQHPFFNVSASNSLTKVNFKFSNAVKQSLKATAQWTEKRFREDQKTIRYRKKLTKMQELLVSDEDGSKLNQRLKEKKNLGSKVRANQVNPNGGRSPRSDSLTSNSTAASIGTMTPPSTARKISSPSPVHSSSSSALDGRSALLDSICSFDKSLLHHRPATVFNGS